MIKVTQFPVQRYSQRSTSAYLPTIFYTRYNILYIRSAGHADAAGPFSQIDIIFYIILNIYDYVRPRKMRLLICTRTHIYIKRSSSLYYASCVMCATCLIQSYINYLYNQLSILYINTSPYYAFFPPSISHVAVCVGVYRYPLYPSLLLEIRRLKPHIGRRKTTPNTRLKQSC